MAREIGTPEFETDFHSGYVDLAIIKVTNTGRTPVSVSDIQLDLGRSGWHRRSRHAIAGRPVVVHECKAIDGDVRLETGQSFSVAMDHEPLIKHALALKSSKSAWHRPFARSVVVRASATGAGRRPVMSDWRRRWKVEANGQGVYYPRPRNPEHDAFLAVFRAVYPRDVTKMYSAWIEVKALWHRGGVGVPEVEETLARILKIDPPNFPLLTDAVQVFAALHGWREAGADDEPA